VRLKVQNTREEKHMERDYQLTPSCKVIDLNKENEVNQQDANCVNKHAASPKCALVSISDNCTFVLTHISNEGNYKESLPKGEKHPSPENFEVEAFLFQAQVV